MTAALAHIPRVVRVVVPVRLASEANVREHWGRRARRARDQRQMTALALRAAPMPRPTPPLRITITRHGVRKLDSDNLARSAKAVRDGVADWLGIDDGDERLTWVYAQQTGRVYEVEILVEPWGHGHEAARAVGMES